MDRFAVMKTFVRVAETGSLSRAARDLGLTQPAVSHQIARLEQRLGVRLIHRTTRGLSLSEAGERYYCRAKEILEAVEAAEDSLGAEDEAVAGLVRIQAPSGFGQKHVTPALIALKNAHSDLVIDLILEDRIADLVSEGVDLAIRLGTPGAPGLTVRRLAKMRRMLVASREYAASHRLPVMPDELAAHPFIRFSWNAEGDELTLRGPNGVVSVTPRPTFLANSAFAIIEAVRSGLGVGAVQAPLVHDLLEGGDLVEVLPNYVYPALELFAVYPSRRFIPRRVRAVVEHLAAALPGVPGLI